MVNASFSQAFDGKRRFLPVTSIASSGLLRKWLVRHPKKSRLLQAQTTVILLKTHRSEARIAKIQRVRTTDRLFHRLNTAAIFRRLYLRIASDFVRV